MTDTRLRMLVMLACGLTAVLAIEFLPAEPQADIDLPAARRAFKPHNNTPAGQLDKLTAQAEAILARPLFNPSRRSAPPPASAEITGSVPPRLSGVISNQSRRLAIFAAPDGKPIVVSEGDRVGPYVVRSIAPGEVTVIGHDGPRQLQPIFDNAPAAVANAKKAPEQPDPVAVAISNSRQALINLVLNGPPDPTQTGR
jgi:hypothetical protein